MRYIISGKNLDITEGLRSAVTEKLGKLERYFTPDTEVHVTLSVEKERQKIEVTIPVKGNIIRSEQSSTDMYVSIDLVEEVIERQLRKYKTRIVERRGGRGSIRHLQPDELDIPDVIPTEPEEDDDLLVRLKEVEMEPMTEEHALVQTDLLGHDFFVYFDQDAHQIQVIYHRKNGGYGIIRPIINA